MKKVISILLIMTLIMGLYLPSVSAAASLSTSPVIHLTFDGDLKDSSGNGYNGSAPDANVTYENGVIGKAAKIDNAMITLVGSNAISLKSAFSLSVWVRLDPDVLSGEILKIKTNTNDELLNISNSYGDTSITTSTFFESKDDPTYGSQSTFYASTNIEPEQNKDRFMHLAIVYNGTAFKYYLDGKLDSSTPLQDYTNGLFFGTGNDIIVGGDAADTFFHGWMDDLQFFNSALPFTDITSLYQAGVKTASNKMVLTIDNPFMMVNGTQKEIDPGQGTAPYVSAQGRTLCPIRAIIESMGGTIAWDGKTQCVTLKKDANVIKLWIGKDKAEVNGTLKEIDPGKGVTPIISSTGRTMLPIRFILEELQLPPLAWNGNLHTITIQY